MKACKILFFLIFLFGIIYYQLDKGLFYYGKNNLQIYHLLPLRIKPEYRPAFEGGFALRDDNGFTIAANGNSYSVDNRKIVINQVLKYGYNEDHLIAVVADVNKNYYYVEFSQNPNDQSVINATIIIDSKRSNLNLYKWINIDNNSNFIWRLALYRNCSMLIIIILVVVFIYTFAKYRKNNKKMKPIMKTE